MRPRGNFGISSIKAGRNSFSRVITSIDHRPLNLASTSGMKGAATATSYSASKWAVRGISQCWQAELRPHGIRVICICPSEVQTNFGGKSGRNNPNKLYAADIADTIMAALDMPRRALWPELAVFANNPWKE